MVHGSRITVCRMGVKDSWAKRESFDLIVVVDGPLCLNSREFGKAKRREWKNIKGDRVWLAKGN